MAHPLAVHLTASNPLCHPKSCLVVLSGEVMHSELGTSFSSSSYRFKTILSLCHSYLVVLSGGVMHSELLEKDGVVVVQMVS